MKKFLLFVLLAAPLCSLAQNWVPYILNHPRYTVDTVHNSQHPYGRIQFLQFLPPDYAGSSDLHPLIIFLHGQTEIEKGDATPGFSATFVPPLVSFALPKYLNSDTTQMKFSDPAGNIHSFVVLIPQKHTELIPHPFLGFQVEAQFPAYYVDAMIKYARDANLKVDFDRVYLTGLSLGSGLVYDYPAYSDANARQIAAIAPVSGNPVYGYKERTPTADLCNIAEHKLGSRAYVGDVDAFFSGGQKLIDQRDSVAFAMNYINNCVAPGKKPSDSLMDNGGHDKPYWDTIFKPSYGTDRGQPELNMYSWMLQHQIAQIITPVTMIYFKGKNLNDQNILQWATSRELNSDRFELMRSTDGENFTVIATFKASDNSSGEKEYSYKDNNAPKGTSHYQLRQVDKDGKVTLSRVITVQNKNQVFVVEKYPNPVSDRLNLTIEGAIFGVIELQVLDLRGNLVKKTVIRKEHANWKGFIDVNGLSKGVYMFQLKASDGKKEVSSFIKN